LYCFSRGILTPHSDAATSLAYIYNCASRRIGQCTNAHVSASRIKKQLPRSKSLSALVDSVKNSMTTLSPAALGLKNPKSQRLFNEDVANIGTLANSLLAALQAVGGTP